MQVTVEAKHLRAMAHLAGTKDIRPQLNGVWIEARRSSVLVATDCTLLAALDTRAQIEEGADFDLFVPNRILAALKKAAGFVIFQSADGKTWTATVVSDGSSHRWASADEVLLDWRRVVPRTTSGETGHFNPELIARFTKTAADLGVKWQDKLGVPVMVAHNGEKPALVQIRDHLNFVGVMSPLQGKAKDYLRPSAPSWVFSPEPECELA